MFRQIMVPLDGSELAERALPPAERMATVAGAMLHLVRVVDLPTVFTPSGLYTPINVYDDLMNEEKGAATRYLESVQQRVGGEGRQAHVVTLTGYAAVALLGYERAAGIDLVVLCSHGRSGLVRFALGSVADHLLHHGTAPLLLVRAFGSPVTFQQAVVPLDGSTCAEQALCVLNALAPSLVREVTLLRVIDAAEQGPAAERYLEEAARRLEGEHLVCWRQVEQGDPAQVIIDVAGTDKLVVMATHGRTGLTRWALGSVADRVARAGGAEVLLVRAGAEPRLLGTDQGAADAATGAGMDAGAGRREA